MSRALAWFACLLLLAPLGGCLGRAEETPPIGPTPPPPDGTTFVVEGLTILRPDGAFGELREDDEVAIVRYRVVQPADAEEEQTAFVTYRVNGAIQEVVQVTLAPGESRAFERRIGLTPETKRLDVEVLAGGSRSTANARVTDWPRAGEGSVTVGAFTVRAEYGFVDQGRKVLVNLTVHTDEVGAEPALTTRLLCIEPDGAIKATRGVSVKTPPAGETQSVNVLVHDCGERPRYGLEFEAGSHDPPVSGRLLIVAPR